MKELSKLISDAKTIKKSKTKRKLIRIENEIIYYQCPKCLIFLSENEYTYSKTSKKLTFIA